MSAHGPGPPGPVPLDDVLVTRQLARRAARPPDYRAESDALAALAEVMAMRPADLLPQLVQQVLALCRADSAGISILETGDVFRWHAVAGLLAPHAGGTIARDASPCGEVIARDQVLLFQRPQRHFRFPVPVDPPIEEALLVPFHERGRAVGTVWAIAQRPDRHFDAEEARLLVRLAAFAAAAHQLGSALQVAQQARMRVEAQVDERTLAAEAARLFAESIVDTMRDPLLVLDAGLHVVSASRAFYDTFRVAHQETLGRRIYELGNGQWDIGALRTLLEDVLPRQTILREFEVEHVFEHLGRRVMLLNARRLRRDGDAQAMILLAIEDVTERREAEAARQEAEARFTEMVKNVRDYAVFMTDAQGTIVSWNVAAESVFGHAEAQAIGQPFSLIFTLEDVAAGMPEHELRQAREHGRAEDERWHLRRNGERFWAQGIVTARRDERGGLVGYSKILRDMSERRRAETALRASEERFRRAMDIGTVGVLFFRLDGRVLDANAAFERLVGYTAEALRALPDWLALTPPEFRASTAHAARELAERGDTAPYEKQMIRRDGTRFWGLFAPTRLSGRGRQTECVEFVLDIGDRKRTEAALRASEERLRLALAAARMGTWHWEVATDRHRRDANLNLLLGLDPAESEQPIAEFLARLHADDVPRVRAAFERAAQYGDALQVDFRVLGAGGEVRWLSGSGDVFGSGPQRYLAGACVDVTDRRRLEDALRQADRRKDEFLAMLGHELRNPLAPLRNALEALRRQNLESGTLERVHAMMDRQVGHLSRLVNDLLDVSRITLGVIDLRRQPLNLAEVVELAVEMAMPAIEGRGHDLSLALPHRPLQVQGDRARLVQVLFNLLHNAAKYSAPGSRIWLTLERDDGHAVVSVRDNGSGMTRELVPHVFEIFTQGTRTLARSQGGLGLGLTLVRRLVEAHGGTVEAASEGPGLGSEFVVRLPVLPALPAQAQPPPEERKVTLPPPRTGLALVVDDVPDIADSYGWLFEGLVDQVEVAYSGAQALEIAGRQRPDLIVCDLGMPDMDGYETCRRLRQLPGLDTTVIAAVSGYGGDEYVRESKAAGFDRHLVKPIGRSTLEELVQAAAAR